MLQYVMRRLLLLIPVLTGIVLVTFIITRAIPSDPCLAMLGEKATKAQCDAFRERFGLNDNVIEISSRIPKLFGGKETFYGNSYRIYGRSPVFF